MLRVFGSNIAKFNVGSSAARVWMRSDVVHSRYFCVSQASQSTKPKVVILGCGWAGFRCAVDIDKNKYDVELISPRNHFLFTPLLPSTAVGTLEFRCIQEPVRTIPGIKYYQAECSKIDIAQRKMHCIDTFNTASQYDVDFDILIYAAGCETNTFGCKGVYDNKHVFFLKQLSHSRSIRNRMIECFERASAPSVPIEEKKRLLTFIIVGGGPTSVEFAAEVYDFLVKDVSRWYDELKPYVSVRLIEASGQIMGTFHRSLGEYTEKLFSRRDIQVYTNISVKEIRENVAVLSSGEDLPFGLMVWSTGVKPVELTNSLGNSSAGGIEQTATATMTRLSSDNIAKSGNGRIIVDDKLRMLHVIDNEMVTNGSPLTFALGDCAANHEKPLPPLAQVAMQHGIYLSKMLNSANSASVSSISSVVDNYKPFKYAHLGAMASVGDWKAVYDSSSIDTSKRIDQELIPPLKGFVAFLMWRAAYWTRAVSISNKILIPMYWLKSAIFGRDISRF